jgi:hypothetical protein
MLADAENEISQAEKTIGRDAVITRHKALLTLRKSELTPGIEESDRKAMLQDAEGIIRRCIRDFDHDLYSYRTLGEIGLAFASRFSEFGAFDDAIDYLRSFESSNGDPEISNVRRELESRLRSLGFEPYSVGLGMEEVEAGLVEVD